MEALQSTTDLLLAAAIKGRDPDAFRVLADACEEAGDERMAKGWRGVAEWMEKPFLNKMDPKLDEKHRWPRGSDDDEDVWFWMKYDKGNEPGNCTPFTQYRKFTTTKAAITWLAECFGDS